MEEDFLKPRFLQLRPKEELFFHWPHVDIQLGILILSSPIQYLQKVYFLAANFSFYFLQLQDGGFSTSFFSSRIHLRLCQDMAVLRLRTNP